MPIRVPESNKQRFVFPFIRLSNRFAYSHLRPDLKKQQVIMDSIEEFFISLHKGVSFEFAEIKSAQGLVLWAFLPLVVILFTFGVILGVYYNQASEVFAVSMSAILIFISAVGYIILSIYVTLRIKKLKKSINSKLERTITEAKEDFAKLGLRWKSAPYDFPYWLELWFENHQDQTVKPFCPLLDVGFNLPKRKKIRSAGKRAEAIPLKAVEDNPHYTENNDDANSPDQKIDLIIS